MIDTKDLPQEVIDQLTGLGRSSGAEKQLMPFFNAANKPLTINDLIVTNYRTAGEVLKRSNVTAKLGRLVKNGVLVKFQVGTEVFYSTPEHAPKPEPEI